MIIKDFLSQPIPLLICSGLLEYPVPLDFFSSLKFRFWKNQNSISVLTWVLVYINWGNQKLFQVEHSNHELRTPRQSFFSKIRKFWAWADKLGWNFGGHFGYYQPNYWHYFGIVSPLFMGKCSWIFFLQKKLVFKSKTYNSQILPK